MAKKKLEIEQLNKLLKYNPKTGVITFKKRSLDMFKKGERQKNAQSIWNSKHAGQEAGVKRSDGYLEFSIFNTNYLAHRIAFAMHNGYWADFIDHINGNRRDNRASNLRDASKSENSRNVGISTRNTSGAVGVYWNKNNNKWIAQIRTNKVMYLGSYDNFDDAVLAREAANKKYGYHENHGKREANQ